MHCGHLIPTRRTASGKKRTGPMPYSLFRYVSYASSASFLPFSIASSIVPTM
jgi:hypothetical protein